MERQEARHTVADESPGSVESAPLPAAPAAAPDTIGLVMRPLAWLAGIVGIAALGRLLARWRAAPAPHDRPAPDIVAGETTVAPAADPAEELRRKLAAQRGPEAATAPDTATEPGVVETLEERRARVHAKAREAMDAMNDEGRSR